MNWEEHLNHQVQIYRNLNNGRMSLRAKVGKSWLVVGHVTDCVITGVKFTIRESGRQRVIRDRQKNVHAWGQGKLIAQFDDRIIANIALAYDPYSDTTFVQRGTKQSIKETCQYLVVRDNQVYVSGDALGKVKPRVLQPVPDRQPSIFGGFLYAYAQCA